MHSETLLQAVQAALDGEWDAAHQIAQSYSHPTANWLHAVLHKLHKMEGDKWNSQYWYARTDAKKYEDFIDAKAELLAIQKSLT